MLCKPAAAFPAGTTSARHLAGIGFGHRRTSVATHHNPKTTRPAAMRALCVMCDQEVNQASLLLPNLLEDWARLHPDVFPAELPGPIYANQSHANQPCHQDRVKNDFLQKLALGNNDEHNGRHAEQQGSQYNQHDQPEQFRPLRCEVNFHSALLFFTKRWSH